MKLRIKFEKDGSSRIIDLPDDATISTLLSTIDSNDVESIKRERDGIPMDLSEPSKCLHEVGVKNLDTIFIKQMSTIKATLKETPTPANDLIEEEEPRMVIRQIADDNSCLFNAIAYVLATQPLYTSTQLRTIVADCILSDPVRFDKVVLEQPPPDYVQWILLNNSWGGAIELNILADWFNVQIGSVDVQTGRIDLFGPQFANERVYVMYSGIHYDALASSPGPSFPQDCDITRFDPADKMTELKVKNLAEEARKRHQYTDLAHFTLKCSTCQTALVGESDARKHAKDTGHTDFVEFN